MSCEASEAKKGVPGDALAVVTIDPFPSRAIFAGSDTEGEAARILLRSTAARQMGRDSDMKRTTSLKALILVAGMIVCSTTTAVEPLRTNGPSFRIPFAVDQAKAGSSATAILFASRDGGPMEPVQRVAASERSFYFLAPSDGKFQFAVRMTDPQGNLIGEDGPLLPELEVIVDSQAPEIQLQLSETSPGEAVLEWSFADDDVDPSTLKIEYLVSSVGQWQPVSAGFPGFGAAANRTKISSNPGQSIAVRATVKDKAGNAGNASEQIVLSTSPGNARNGFGQSSAGNVAVGPNTGLNIPSDGPTMILGNSPFGADETPAARPSVGSQNRTVSRPVSLNDGSDGGHRILSIPGDRRSNAAGLSAHQTPTIVAGPSESSPRYPSSGQSPGTDNQMGIQHLNNRLFDLAYEIDSVGPSGVSSVTLYVTEDNGRNWFRYGLDKDLKSPFKIDTRGEGTFGFAVRVRNGVGFSDPPPQPGEVPTIVVSVDQTPPVLRLAAPELVAQGQGIVRLKWDLQEANPAEESVRLEYAVTAEGPWSPVFDWQSNPGGFELPINTSMPPALHFRLLARDAAGNVSSTQTGQPVLIDRNRPKARVLSVKPAASAVQGF